MIDDRQDVAGALRGQQPDRPEFLITPCAGGFDLLEDGVSRGWYRMEAFAAAAAVTAAQERGAPRYVIHYP